MHYQKEYRGSLAKRTPSVRATARIFIAVLVVMGLLTSLPMASQDAAASRLINTFDDGADSKTVVFATDPLPGEMSTLYINVKGDVTVTQASLNISASLLETAWRVGANPPLSGLGFASSTMGDITGDGLTDLTLTAPGTSTGQGLFIVLVGRNTGYQVPPQDVTVAGTNNNDLLGYSLSTAGDMNKDGYDDIVTSRIKMDFATPASTAAGDVLFFYGASTGTGVNTTPDRVISTGANGDMFGYSISTHGDVNNDGYTDMVVGAPRNALNQNNPGRAYLYLSNGTSGPGTSANATIVGSDNGDGFGSVVYIPGDVNNDGYDDVLVTASGHNTSTKWDVGKAYLYFGNVNGINATPDWTYTGKVQNDRLGFSATGIGDANGDGYADIALGVPLHDEGTTTDAGGVLVFYGGASGLAASPDVTIVGDTSDGLLGFDVAHAGDIDNDSLGDLMAGAPNTNNGTLVSAGHVQIHFGDLNGIAAKPDKVLKGWDNNGNFGSVGPGGDGNGDGYADIITADSTLQFTHVYYGGASARDPTVYIDDVQIHKHAGAFRGEDRTLDFSDVLNAYIQDHQGDVDALGYLKVPINVSLSKAGQVNVHTISVQVYMLAQPDGLTATPMAYGNAIKLSWTDHTTKQDDISKMAIEYWNGTGWEEIEKVMKNEDSYIVEGLEDGIEYKFRLRAFDGGVQKFSEPSLEVTVTQLPRPCK